MSICTDLKTIFPAYNFSDTVDEVLVEELDRNNPVKVKEVKWKGDKVEFHYLDTKIVKKLTGFFQSSHSVMIFNKDCDGIIAFEIEGQKYLFFNELKSTFDSSDIYKAMIQIISSFIKINMILNLLKDYHLEDYKICAFIASVEPTSECKRVMGEALLLPSTSNYKTEAQFSSEMCVLGEVDVNSSKCEKLRGVNLGSNCLFSKMKFIHLPVPTGQDSLEVNVSDYIGRL